MCGLFGAFGSLDEHDKDVVRQLAILSSLRGTDSTGIGVRSFSDDVGEMQVYKAVVSSSEFVDFPRVQRLMHNVDQLLIGHTRYRTSGGLTKANAQPFELDNVVGCHNGTLKWSTHRDLEGAKNFEVDSFALYNKLNADGLKAVVALLNPEDDAAALVWYNREAHTLNFWRNAKRTLYYVFDEKRKRMYWASEAGMLYLVLNRNGVTFDKVRAVPEETHFSFKVPDKVGAKIDKAVVSEVKQVKVPFVQRLMQQGNANGRMFAGMPNTSSSVTTAPCTVIPLNSRSNDRVTSPFTVQKDDSWRVQSRVQAQTLSTPSTPGVIDLSLFKMDRPIMRLKVDGGDFYLSSATHKRYDLNDFELHVNSGCCQCGCVPVWGEPIKFLQNDEIMCAACVSDAKDDAGIKRDSDTLRLLRMFSSK